MLARIFMRLWMALAVLSPATAAHATTIICDYVPGTSAYANPAAAGIPDEFRATIVLKKGTIIETNSKKSPNTFTIVCIGRDLGEVLLFDSRLESEGGDVVIVNGLRMVKRGTLVGCGNLARLLNPIPLPEINNADKYRVLEKAKWKIVDMAYGSSCGAGLRTWVRYDGTIDVRPIMWEKDCKCVVRNYQLRSEADLEEQMIVNASTKPLARFLGDITDDPNVDPSMRDPGEKWEAFESFWTDRGSLKAKGGLGFTIVVNQDTRTVDFYKESSCQSNLQLGFAGGLGAVVLGAGDHSVIGAFGVMTLHRNGVGGRIGGYIGADHATATVSGMPLAGPEFRLYRGPQGAFEMWGGPDLIVPMGPSWAAVGGQAHIAFDGAVTNTQRPIFLGAEFAVGGAGAVAGDCESGTVLSANFHGRW
jgi:hypothetical protein